MNELEYEKRFSSLEYKISTISDEMRELISSNKVLTNTMIENQGKSKFINVLMGVFIPLVISCVLGIVNIYKDNANLNQEQDNKMIILDRKIDALDNKNDIRILKIENKLKIKGNNDE